MIRPQRYVVTSLKRFATMSITSRLAGICSAISFADSSTSTMAEDSSGSRKPPARPTATQLFFQNVSRWPERMRDLANRQVLVLRSDVRAQRLTRRFLARMAAGIDVADAAPRGQADVPDPAGLCAVEMVCDAMGASARLVRDLHRERRVAEQDVAAVLEADAERLADAAGRRSRCSRRTGRP